MPALSTNPPRFLPAGDQAVVVEFGEVIDSAINERVHTFDADLRRSEIAGVIESIPTYRSVLVQFDPLTIEYEMLCERLKNLALRHEPEQGQAVRLWRIPVTYGGENGPDLDAIADELGISSDEVVRLHTSGEYAVYMLGFSPGFPYLGGVPPRLHLPRRLSPRLKTPARSVMIGGQQACILPSEMPSGWHVLGRTPVRPFVVDRPEPFLFRPGDHLRFFAIDAGEMARLEAQPDWQPDCGLLP